MINMSKAEDRSITESKCWLVVTLDNEPIWHDKNRIRIKSSKKASFSLLSVSLHDRLDLIFGQDYA